MVQLQILNKILQSKDISIIKKNNLTSEYFNEYTDEFVFIVTHFDLYGNVPDKETFIAKFNDFDFIEVTESDKALVDTICEEHLYQQMCNVIRICADKIKDNSNDAVEYLKSQLPTLAINSAHTYVDIVKQAQLRLEEFNSKQNKDKPWCISTGFEELDAIVQGWARGEEFVVFFARTGQGKSWILSKTATHAWEIGYNVGYISPEMSSNKIGYRFDTYHNHFSNTGLMQGKADGYEDYINELQTKPNSFIVAVPQDFNKRITVGKLRQFVLENKLDMLCVDGITYLSDERGSARDNKTTTLTNISEDLMSLSLELQIPILVVVQSNRGGVKDENENGTPELENIRDSDGIAQNATKVISLRQTGPGLEMGIKKNRDGANGGKLVYTWDIDTGIFTYIPGENDVNAIKTSSHSTHKPTPSRGNSSNNNSNSLANIKPEPRMAFADGSSPF